MHDELKVPITDIDDAQINHAPTCRACTPPYSSWGISQGGKSIKGHSAEDYIPSQI